MINNMSKKYYIKCDKCAQLVEMKSQYMVMCPSCKHKMGNSFMVWSGVHLDSSYNDFLSSECVNGAALEGVGQQRRISKSVRQSRAFKLAMISFLGALLVTIVVLLSMWFLRGVGSDRSIRAILDDNWKINFYDDLGATVRFPFVLKSVADTTFAVPDTATNVKRLVARQWVKPTVCNVTVMQVEYSDRDANRDEATKQILQSIIAENGMEAFNYVPSDYDLAGAQARMLNGSYLVGTLLTEFRAVMVTKDKQVWYFMVAYPSSMPEGTLLAEKFFKTVQLN